MSWREIMGVSTPAIRAQNPQNPLPSQPPPSSADIAYESTVARHDAEIPGTPSERLGNESSNPTKGVSTVLLVSPPCVSSPQEATPEPESIPSWRREVIPNSRSPLIPAGIREKIEAIEADARSQGWPPELLWNSGFWDSPRGLACLLDETDEIVEVTEDEIVILKLKHDLQRFRRRSS